MALPFFGRLRGRAPIVPGSQSYTTPGTYNFIVPEFNTITFDLYGAGGHGGGISWNAPNQGKGGDGQACTIAALGLSAGGGVGGSGGYYETNYSGGAGGTASGGDTNTSGGAGGTPTAGTTPNGGPGVGGTGGGPAVSWYAGGGGGGARCVKTYAAGQLAVGTQLTIVVPPVAPSNYSNITHPGTAGGPGKCVITWS